MLRTVVTRNVRVAVARVSYPRTFTTSYPRKFFGGKNNDPPADPKEVFDKFATTLKSNPELGQLLSGFQELLASKGIETNGKAPSMTQMMKMLTDSDIREHLSKLKDALDAADIKINQQDVSALTDIFLNQQKNQK